MSIPQRVFILAALAYVLAVLSSAGVLPGEPPIDAPGLNVLVVRSLRDDMTSGQVSCLTSFVAYVESLGGKCRILPPDDDDPKLEPHWKKALARERSSRPWLIVSNGSGGFEGPYPEQCMAAEAKVAEYAGGRR